MYKRAQIIQREMNKIISPFLAGLAAALIFIALRPKFGGWAIIIAIVSFPIIFWIVQAFIDIICNVIKGGKK